MLLYQSQENKEVVAVTLKGVTKAFKDNQGGIRGGIKELDL